MDFRNPATMTPEEMVLEMQELQQGLTRGAVRIHELSRFLYQRVRRAPADDTTSIYVTYANALTRFSGVVQQGIGRLKSAERVLGMLPKAEREETPPPAPRREPETGAAARRSPLEDLMDLYGQEMTNASERP